MDVMSALSQVVMLSLVPSVLVYGKVFHHVLRVRQAMPSKVTVVYLLSILVSKRGELCEIIRLLRNIKIYERVVPD
jgi:xanthosine utilization system XapX-like protein